MDKDNTGSYNLQTFVFNDDTSYLQSTISNSTQKSKTHERTQNEPKRDRFTCDEKC